MKRSRSGRINRSRSPPTPPPPPPIIRPIPIEAALEVNVEDQYEIVAAANHDRDYRALSPLLDNPAQARPDEDVFRPYPPPPAHNHNHRRQNFIPILPPLRRGRNAYRSISTSPVHVSKEFNKYWSDNTTIPANSVQFEHIWSVNKQELIKHLDSLYDYEETRHAFLFNVRRDRGAGGGGSSSSSSDPLPQDPPVLESPPFGPMDDPSIKFYLKLYPKGLATGDNANATKTSSTASSSSSSSSTGHHNQSSPIANSFKKHGALRLCVLGEDELQVKLEVKSSGALFMVSGEGQTEGRAGRDTLTGQWRTLDLTGALSWLHTPYYDDQLNVFEYLPRFTTTGSSSNSRRDVVDFPVRITFQRICERPALAVLRAYESLRKRPRFTDVTLRCSDGVELAANKAILAARSPVFDAMFDSEAAFKESQGKDPVVDIVDISGEIMDILLDHIYTGDTSRVSGYALELLEAADKYDVKSLMPVCISWMRHNLTIGNSAHIFAIADLHSLDELASAAIDFINAHHEEVMATDGWAHYIRPRVELLEKLYLGKVGVAGGGGSGGKQKSKQQPTSAVAATVAKLDDAEASREEPDGQDDDREDVQFLYAGADRLLDDDFV